MLIKNLGLIDYKEALDLQRSTVDAVINSEQEELIYICHHDPVVTLGKKTEPGDICGWQGKTYEIKRGGRATYHGPGQVVAYPILDLKKRGRDIHQFLRNLENSMIDSFSHYGFETIGNQDHTGVWIGELKIASIGVAIKRWVTYHGLALNLFEDKEAFQGINPCGIDPNRMTYLQKHVEAKIERADFENLLSKNLDKYLSL